MHNLTRPVTSLGHQAGQGVFREGPKFVKLCPIVLNMSNTFFQGGEQFCRGGAKPLLHPLFTGLKLTHKRYQGSYLVVADVEYR